VKIIVCVKQVPDTAATMSVDNGVISWGDAPLIINPWDEYAVEAALNLVADQGGDVTALCLGKEGETEAIKHALAMGADTAVMISDPGRGSGAVRTAICGYRHRAASRAGGQSPRMAILDIGLQI